MPLVAFNLQGSKCGLPPVLSKYTVTHFSVYKVLPFNTYILKGLLSSIIIMRGTVVEPSKGYNDRPSTAPPHPPTHTPSQRQLSFYNPNKTKLREVK